MNISRICTPSDLRIQFDG